MAMDRKRKAILIFRAAFAAAIAATVIIACMSHGEFTAQVSDDSVFERHDLYIDFDGTITLGNPMNSGIDDATVALYFDDVKNGKRITIWEGDGITIGPRSQKDISVEFRISAAALFTAVLDSVRCEGSPLECSLEVSGKCLYGLVDADFSSRIGIPLAQSGTIIGYTVEEDTSHIYSVSASNLADWLIPPDDTVTMTSGAYTLEVSIANDGGKLLVTAESPQDIEDTLAAMAGGVDSVSVVSGAEMTPEDAQAVAAAIQYARWIL